MNRKECEKNCERLGGMAKRSAAMSWSASEHGGAALGHATLTFVCNAQLAVLAVTAFSVSTNLSSAGTIRLWPTAVVTDDAIRLADVAELHGFDPQLERKLSTTTVADAPTDGGSRMVSVNVIRAALAADGVNMARIALSGATQCAVTRPKSLNASANESAVTATQGNRTPKAGAESLKSHAAGVGSISAPARNSQESQRTLRQAVIELFNKELRSYGGQAELQFDRTSQQTLELSEPAYEFVVRRRGNEPLGIVSVEVDVLAFGKLVQSVPMVVQVSMQRATVVARRAINQGAALGTSDVEMRPMTFRRPVQQTGFTSTDPVVGQRAKRYIPAGAVVETDMLEPVPVVVRGQIVTVTSSVGGISVVTTGKALSNGLVGERVRVQAAEPSSIELDAMVVGPGKVQVGTEPQTSGRPDSSGQAIGGMNATALSVLDGSNRP